MGSRGISEPIQINRALFERYDQLVQEQGQLWDQKPVDKERSIQIAREIEKIVKALQALGLEFEYVHDDGWIKLSLMTSPPLGVAKVK